MLRNQKVLTFTSESGESLVCEVAIVDVDGDKSDEKHPFKKRIWSGIFEDLLPKFSSIPTLVSKLDTMRRKDIFECKGSYPACEIDLGKMTAYTSNYRAISYTIVVREAYLNAVTQFDLTGNKSGTYKENQLASGPPTAKDQPSV